MLFKCICLAILMMHSRGNCDVDYVAEVTCKCYYSEHFMEVKHILLFPSSKPTTVQFISNIIEIVWFDLPHCPS